MPETTSSPRLWGCFSRIIISPQSVIVFPTLVGVFPSVGVFLCRAGGLPHACGGVSGLVVTCMPSSQSSPRLWGCFRE